MNIDLGSIEHSKIIATKVLNSIIDELKIRKVEEHSISSLEVRIDSIIYQINDVVKKYKIDTKVRLCPLKKTQQRLCNGKCKHYIVRGREINNGY